MGDFGDDHRGYADRERPEIFIRSPGFTVLRGVMHSSTRCVRLVMALALSLVLPACSPLALVNALVPRDGYQRETDVTYGPEPRHRLDVYRPVPAAESKTVVVFLYGGGWKKGERSHYRFVGEAFAARGYTVVIPDYRIYPKARFPDFVEDAAAAVGWVRRNIAAHGANPNRIVLVGHSAGAHIAALVTLDRRYLEAAGVPEGTIVGWAGLAGPYTFNPTTYPSTKAIFETAARVQDTRPVDFVHAEAPPALLLHGTDDDTVRPENSEGLARSLEAAGVSVRYVPLTDVGHIGILLALAKPFQSRAPVVDEITEFLERLDG